MLVRRNIVIKTKNNCFLFSCGYSSDLRSNLLTRRSPVSSLSSGPSTFVTVETPTLELLTGLSVDDEKKVDINVNLMEGV